MQNNFEKMIQRKQTLFLLLAAIVVFPLYFMPFASFMYRPNEFEIFVRGLKEVSTGGCDTDWLSYSVLWVATFLPIVTICLFKKRKVQLILCLVQILILAILTGLIIAYITGYNRVISAESASALVWSWVAVTPVISIILTFLAYRGVTRDELLIKSLNRIR